MKRYDIIQHFIDKYNFQSYLEIGYLNGECFDKIECPGKLSIDPNGQAMFIGTSDEFFETNIEKWDLVFLDALHIYPQVLKDLNNILKCLNKNGIIVVHDILPKIEDQQLPKNINAGIPWTGDTWCAFADLRCSRNDLIMYTIDTDWGCGVIKYGSQILYTKPDNWTWDYYINHRNELLNIISVKQFMEM